MNPASLGDFEAKFRADPDPWLTHTARDEALKRAAVIEAVGLGRRGRVLELGGGNGSNSVGLARHALRLDSTDGVAAAVALTAEALAAIPRARARVLALPAHLDARSSDAVVIAELLYYLPARAMSRTAAEVARALPVGGRLVLAHHRVDFHDFAQHAAGIHRRFLEATGVEWRSRVVRRTRRWIVEACDRVG